MTAEARPTVTLSFEIDDFMWLKATARANDMGVGQLCRLIVSERRSQMEADEENASIEAALAANPDSDDARPGVVAAPQAELPLDLIEKLQQAIAGRAPPPQIASNRAYGGRGAQRQGPTITPARAGAASAGSLTAPAGVSAEENLGTVMGDGRGTSQGKITGIWASDRIDDLDKLG